MLSASFHKPIRDAPWSLAKVWDLLKHLWLPALIASVTGTAGIIRIMRGNLLETLGQPYIEAARARGLKERTVSLETCCTHCHQSADCYFRFRSTARNYYRQRAGSHCAKFAHARSALCQRTAKTGYVYGWHGAGLLYGIGADGQPPCRILALGVVDPRIRYD